MCVRASSKAVAVVNAESDPSGPSRSRGLGPSLPKGLGALVSFLGETASRGRAVKWTLNSKTLYISMFELRKKGRN